MPKFLNTQKLNHFIPLLIKNSTRELVIITPYIKLSSQIYKALVEADNSNIETIIVYRENKLSPKQKEKLYELNNLTLLNHPNIHSKCIYNGDFLIIGSMNLYEYSEKFNREMGVLFCYPFFTGFEKYNEKDDFMEGFDGYELFIDFSKETREIINSAIIEKESVSLAKEGFDIEIIKSDFESAWDECKILNKAFINKKYEPKELNGEWLPYCNNYFDKIDVYINYRIEIRVNLPIKELNKVHSSWKSMYGEYMFKGFKVYWNRPNEPVYLYEDSKYKFWQELDVNKDFYNYSKAIKKGIDEFVITYRELFDKNIKKGF